MAARVIERLAPAKVNLFLHVGPLGQDGYHPVSSLMAFADIGDVIRFEDTKVAEFKVTGPFGEGLSAGTDNLVVRARDAALATFEAFDDTFRLTLDKRLPIAAGLGGGSSDAAAALMVMHQALNFDWTEEDGDPLGDIARSLGADVTACLTAAPVLATGRGDELDYPPAFADLDVVLVNPGVASPTGAVYRAYDDAGAPGGADTPDYPEWMETPQAVAAFLARCRNDLEAPAIALNPEIGRALDLLRAQPETLLARMSGSGATSFAICRHAQDAADLALRLSSAHADWWVQQCRLAGFQP